MQVCSHMSSSQVNAAFKDSLHAQHTHTHTCVTRYQHSYRELAKKHPGFRERSETTELIVEISLQPWRSFRPDGVIIFR